MVNLIIVTFATIISFIHSFAFITLVVVGLGVIILLIISFFIVNFFQLKVTIYLTYVM